MRAFRIAMAVAVVVCLLPFASLLVSVVVAKLGNCALDEGSVHPCVIAGVDLGAALYDMFVLTWLGLLTLPLLAFSVLLWIIVEVIAKVHRRNRAPSPAKRTIMTGRWISGVSCEVRHPGILCRPATDPICRS